MQKPCLQKMASMQKGVFARFSLCIFGVIKGLGYDADKCKESDTESRIIQG